MNAAEIKIKETTPLKNLYKTDETISVIKEIKNKFERIRNETLKINKNKTNEPIIFKPKMRIFNYPILLKNITDHFKNKNFTAIKNKTAVGDNSATNIILSKIKKCLSENVFNIERI